MTNGPGSNARRALEWRDRSGGYGGVQDETGPEGPEGGFVRRRISAIAMVAALWALLLLPGTAAAYTKYGTWSPSAGGALKSYTFDAYSTRCSAGYRLRIELELGKVTTTTAYVRTVRFYFSSYNNIYYTHQGTSFTSIHDNYGHVAEGDDNYLHPLDNNIWTWNVGRTFTFNRDAGIHLERTDEYSSKANCGGYFQFDILATAT